MKETNQLLREYNGGQGNSFWGVNVRRDLIDESYCLGSQLGR